MKKGMGGLWWIFALIVFVSVTGITSISFIGDTTSEAEDGIMGVVGNINNTLSETQKQYKNKALSSLKISGDLQKYLDDLNETLVHVRDRPSLDADEPCMYRLPNPSTLNEELLTIKIFESEETSSFGSGVRIQTLIGQQEKDRFNIPDLQLCAVGGSDSAGKVYSEKFHNWYWKVDPIPSKSGIINLKPTQWTYLLNSGSDMDTDYMVVDAILSGDEPYKLEVGNLGDFWDTGSGDWVFSPSKGIVCIIPSYDSYWPGVNYDHPGFHPDAIDRMFENDFGSVVKRTDMPRHTGNIGWRSGKTPTGLGGFVGGKPYDIMPVCH